MEADVIAKATELAETARTTKHSHAFEKAVEGFARLLATVPDFPPAAFSDNAVGSLQELSEQVIAHIEERVNTKQDSASVQRDIVEAVYEIRRMLEDIDRWRRHYLGRNHSNLDWR